MSHELPPQGWETHGYEAKPSAEPPQTVKEKVQAGHWLDSGSPKGCIANIVSHLNVLLTPAIREEVNWHEGQSVQQTVLRIIADYVELKASPSPPAAARHEDEPEGICYSAGRCSACGQHYYHGPQITIRCHCEPAPPQPSEGQTA
jgi:hypothetical protein